MPLESEKFAKLAELGDSLFGRVIFSGVVLVLKLIIEINGAH